MQACAGTSSSLTTRKRTVSMPSTGDCSPKSIRVPQPAGSSRATRACRVPSPRRLCTTSVRASELTGAQPHPMAFCTAFWELTAQQPDVNIVRTALQALAAVLGGAQSLHTNSRDEALALPTEESARIALRTQQIVAYESGVTNTVDPVGGSECIEALTDAIERGVYAY